MTASNQESRDWYRLHRSRTGERLEPGRKGATIGKAAVGLKPITEPVNHDGMDLSILPPMREALISQDDVRRLFADIEASASDVLLMQRSCSARRATASRAISASQLEVAMDSLLEGVVSRLQIRYRWRATDWIDTLETQESGYRLIRIAHNLNNANRE